MKLMHARGQRILEMPRRHFPESIIIEPNVVAQKKSKKRYVGAPLNGYHKPNWTSTISFGPQMRWVYPDTRRIKPTKH